MSFRFDRVNIEILNRCNLQCSFCPPVLRSDRTLSPRDFERITKEVKPFTDNVCLHLMGDPLLHPDLSAIVECCADHELHIQLVTNGTLLSPAITPTLLNPAITQISFSIHSFLDNFPNQDPKRYLEKIFDFTEKAFEQRPDLYINYRLWNLSSAGTPARSESNSVLYSLIEDRFGLTVPKDINVRRKRGYPLIHRLSLHFDTEFTWPALDLPTIHTHGTCKALQNHIGILVDGTVVPCCLDKESVIPLGNLFESPLKSILHSDRAQTMLNGFKKGLLLEPLCQRCNFVTRFSKQALRLRRFHREAKTEL